MMLRTLVGFCVVAGAAAQSTKPVDAEALLADDECTASGGDEEACALNAVQLRGGRVKDVVQTMTALEAANEAQEVTSGAAEHAHLAANEALAIAWKLQKAQADEEAASQESNQMAAKESPNATNLLTPAEAAMGAAAQAYQAASAATRASDSSYEVAEALRRQAGQATAEDGAASAEEGEIYQKGDQILVAQEAATAAAEAKNASESLLMVFDASKSIAVELGAEGYLENDEEAEEAASDAATSEDSLEEPDELPVDVVQDLADRADTYPDLASGPDVEGPYTAEPSDEEAPRHLSPEHSLLQAGGKANSSSYGSAVCTSHQTGLYCDGTTQIRCCQKDFNYVKCGSTWHSTSCGWSNGGGNSGGMWDDRRRYDDRRRTYYSSYSSGGGGYDSRRRSYYSGGGGGGWTIHRGWHQSTFCTSHHTGSFCSTHHTVRCCNDHGHFVECSTSTDSSHHC